MSGLTEGLTLAGRFKLIRRLGTGAFGEVWLAADRELGQEVALKLLTTTAADGVAADALRRECEQLRALSHPAIVRVYAVHRDGPWHFISMQAVEGDTLAALRGHGFREIVRAVLLLVDALEHAHANGVVHRDLKASNVLRDAHGTVYLTDFGVAAALARAPAAAGRMPGGTLSAMSPQQLDGEPAAIADDVYSLGALLYDLLSGQPLLGPDVSAERVRTEVPAPLGRDGRGEPVPPALASLVAAMLDKSPERRPAGMAAVRVVLDEVLRESTAGIAEGGPGPVIAPRRRGSGSPPPAQAAGPGSRPLPLSKAAHRGLPPGLVYAGLGILLVLGVAVVWLLPQAVEERGPVIVAPAPAPRAQSAAPDADTLRAQRDVADEALGRLLALLEELKAAAVERWGGADWLEASRLSAQGDEEYRRRDYAAALASYRRAVELLEGLEQRRPRAFAEALAAGRAALEAADQPAAIAGFELAAAIDKENDQAQRGLTRARQLDQVLAQMSSGEAAELAGDLGAARSAYEAALGLDADWAPARAAVARVRQAAATGAYERAMATGLEALAAGRFDAARTALRRALEVRPGDADASAALEQVTREERVARIVALQSEAAALARAERWQEAAGRYEAMLAIDGALAEARTGLERSRYRSGLAARLERQIAEADRLNEDAVWRQAEALVGEARAVEGPAPQLERSAAELERLLRIAAIPVPVRFESDNATDVMIYKVGRLGTFTSRTVDLRPGAYVAVGRRDGFRDVRQSFRVTAEGSNGPVVLRCEEAI